MKCPKCGNKVHANVSMVCSCGYRFILKPEDALFSDAFMFAAIKRATKNNSYYVTPNQVSTAFIQLIKKKNRLSRIALFASVILFISAMFLYFYNSLPFAKISAVLSIGIIIYIIIKIKGWKPVPSPYYVNTLVGYFKSMKDSQIIFKPSLKNKPGSYNESDIYDYGFEHILVVGNDLLVDMFVKNNFHADERTLVISAGGYPEYLVPHVSKIMNDDPEMPVFYLHDSSTSEEKNISRFLKVLGIKDEKRRIIDLGLRQEDVSQFTFISKVYDTKITVPVDVFPYRVIIEVILQAFQRYTDDIIDMARTGSDPFQSGTMFPAAFLYFSYGSWSESFFDLDSSSDFDLSFG